MNTKGEGNIEDLSFEEVEKGINQVFAEQRGFLKDIVKQTEKLEAAYEKDGLNGLAGMRDPIDGYVYPSFDEKESEEFNKIFSEASKNPFPIDKHFSASEWLFFHKSTDKDIDFSKMSPEEIIALMDEYGHYREQESLHKQRGVESSNEKTLLDKKVKEIINVLELVKPGLRYRVQHINSTYIELEKKMYDDADIKRVVDYYEMDLQYYPELNILFSYFI